MAMGEKFLRAAGAALLGCLGAEAHAYIGPGLASGVLATVLGLIAALGMLLFGIIWYPIKRLWRYFRSR